VKVFVVIFRRVCLLGNEIRRAFLVSLDLRILYGSLGWGQLLLSPGPLGNKVCVRFPKMPVYIKFYNMRSSIIQKEILYGRALAGALVLEYLIMFIPSGSIVICCNPAP